MNPALLHIASLLLPRAHRGEWLAEWRGELWQVKRAGGNGRTFCLGAFHDAFWLRRHATLPRSYGPLLIDSPRIVGEVPPPENRLLESPWRCIGLLAFLAALSLVIHLLPAVRHFDRERIPALLLVAAGASLVVRSATSISLGDYPGQGYRLRRWLFFLAKMALLLPTVIFGALDIAGASKNFAPIGVQITFWGAFLGIRWALLDQRRRCPVCLRLLANPVRIGECSHILLEWNGIELVCLRGHGILHVPEGPSIWLRRQRWLCFDSSWRNLF